MSIDDNVVLRGVGLVCVFSDGSHLILTQKWFRALLRAFSHEQSNIIHTFAVYLMHHTLLCTPKLSTQKNCILRHTIQQNMHTMPLAECDEHWRQCCITWCWSSLCLFGWQSSHTHAEMVSHITKCIFIRANYHNTSILQSFWCTICFCAQKHSISRHIIHKAYIQCL